jgi:hypothetical protein
MISAETSQKYKYYKILIFGVQIMALQIRRGTDAERLEITPLQGELIFTTDNKEVYVGDGTTVGGIGITGSGGGGSVTDEQIQDVVGPMFTGGTHSSNISFQYNDTTGKINATVTNAFTNLDALTDVVLTSAANGQVLKYNGSQWVNAAESGGGGATALTDLTDVTIGSPGTGEVLAWDGDSWANQIPPVGITSLSQDFTPTLGGNLLLNSFDITGTGNISVTGNISATGNVTVGNTVLSRNPSGTLFYTTGGSKTLILGTFDYPNKAIFNSDQPNIAQFQGITSNAAPLYVSLNSSKGTMLSRLVPAPGDELGGYRIQCYRGAGAYVTSSVWTANLDSTADMFADNPAVNVILGVANNTDFRVFEFKATGTFASAGAVQVGSFTSTPETRPTGVAGMIIFNTTTSKHQAFDGTIWHDLY